MSVKTKHRKYILKKLKGKKIAAIEKIDRLPTGITFVSWSLGFEAETEYTYHIKTKDNDSYYCSIVSFLSLIILQSRFYQEIEGKYIRQYT